MFVSFKLAFRFRSNLMLTNRFFSCLRRYTDEEIEKKINKFRVDELKKADEAAKQKQQYFQLDDAGRPL